MPSIAVGQIIEVTYKASCDSQVILNVFHYKVLATGGGDLFGALQALITELQVGGGPQEGLLSVLAADYVMNEITAQAIWGTRYRLEFQLLDPTKPGTHGGTAMPSSVSAAVTKQSDGTGPHSHGQMRLAGIPSTGVSLGTLTPAYLTELTTNMSWMKTNVVVGATTYQPIIYDRTTPGSSEVITQIAPMTETRTMKRRVVGRGI